MKRYYAGIGSRDTPFEICDQMTLLAKALRAQGFTLRSGGARRADTAFARGAGEDAVIYLPWAEYEIEETGAQRVVCGEDLRLRLIAERLHPKWGACGRRARALLTRNVAQMIGAEKEDPPSELAICWTPRASGSGGTGGALRVADTRVPVIPVYDLALPFNFPYLMERFAEKPTKLLRDEQHAHEDMKNEARE